MADGATTSFQQDDEQKRRWKEAVEANGEYQSLSHLIRLSVEKELSEGDGGGGSVPEEFPRQVRQLSETVEAVDQKLSQLHERMGDVEQYLKQEAPETQELASKVFPVLPTRGNSSPKRTSRWSKRGSPPKWGRSVQGESIMSLPGWGWMKSMSGRRFRS